MGKASLVNDVRSQRYPRLPALNPSEPYDLVFIDAQKSGYPDYLRSVLAHSQPGSAQRLLRPGGLIVGDNVLRWGIVADDSDDNPHAVERRANPGEGEKRNNRDVEAVREFNDLLVGNERLETLMMPLWDGLAVARLVD